MIAKPSSVTVRFQTSAVQADDGLIESLGLDRALLEAGQVIVVPSRFDAWGKRIEPETDFPELAPWTLIIEECQGVRTASVNGQLLAAHFKVLERRDWNRLGSLPYLTSIGLAKNQFKHIKGKGRGPWYSYLPDVSSLSALTQLTCLDLSECRSLTDLRPIRNLTQLTRLDLRGCVSLVDLSPLSGLTQLTSLKLGGCESLTDVSSLTGLTQLTRLDLRECVSLVDLSPLSGLTQLTSLKLGGCESLTDVSSLTGLRQLTRLDLRECVSLTDLSPLSGLTQLVTLRLKGAWYLNREDRLQVLAQLENLKTLEGISNPDLARTILLRCALKRSDAVACRRLISDLVPILQGSGRAELVPLVAQACRLACCEPPAEYLETALSLSKMDAESWASVIKNLDLAVPAFLRGWLNDLLSDMTNVDFLGGVLARASEDWRPTALSDWLDRWLEPLDGATAASIGPQICLAWRRLDRPDREQAWLKRLTDQEGAGFRDRVFAFYGLRALQADKTPDAIQWLGKVAEDDWADPVRAELAKVLADQSPEEAGAWLEQIKSANLRFKAAEKARSSAAFMGVEKNIERLLIQLGADPDALLSLLDHSFEEHPDHLWLVELRNQVFTDFISKGLKQELLELLEHNAIVEATRPWQLRQFRDRIESDPELNRRALRKGVLQVLQEEGLIDENEAVKLRFWVLGQYSI